MSLLNRLLYKIGIKKPPPFPFLKISMLIVGFIGVAVGITLLRLSQDIRNQARREAILNQPVPLLVEFKLDDTGKPQITRSEVLPPSHTHRPIAKPNTRLSLKTPQGTTQTLSVSFTDTIIGESLLLVNPSAPPTDPRLGVPATATTIINYSPGSQLQSQGQTLDTNTLDTKAREYNQMRVSQTPQVQSADSQIPSSNDLTKLDILFIASSYTNFTQFQSDAEAMYHKLIQTLPWSDYSQAITYLALKNQIDLGCRQINSALLCDEFLVRKAASQVPHDTIVVIHNTNTYAGSALQGQNLAYVYRNVAESAKEVFVHELSHSFADLMDEYSYGVPWVEEPDLTYNCDAREPCNKWQGVSRAACFAECTFTNAYRSTLNDSYMRTLYPTTGFHLGPEAELVTRRRLELFGLSPNPGIPPILDTASDINQDSYQDILDTLFTTSFFNRPSNIGDINLTGAVDFLDFSQTLKEF